MHLFRSCRRAGTYGFSRFRSRARIARTLVTISRREAAINDWGFLTTPPEGRVIFPGLLDGSQRLIRLDMIILCCANMWVMWMWGHARF